MILPSASALQLYSPYNTLSVPARFEAEACLRARAGCGAGAVPIPAKPNASDYGLVCLKGLCGFSSYEVRLPKPEQLELDELGSSADQSMA